MSKRSETKDGDESIPEWADVDFKEIELGERIGGGGVGIVYQGWWKDQPVALKTLFDARISADLKQEYMDELLVMSRVSHSNIVKFLGACMKPPNLCFIMELCETSLFNILHVKRINLSVAECFQASIDIASALEYLHSLTPTIIHRDLKSHNILKADNGSYKLCDFGLVRNRNAAAGTPAYMAPELLENGNFTKSVDCYAMGMVLWELFTREIPFGRMDVSEIRQRVLAGKRPAISSYSMHPRVASLITKCWSQHPEDRPSASEIVDELLELERIVPTSSFTDSTKDSVGDILDDFLVRK